MKDKEHTSVQCTIWPSTTLKNVCTAEFHMTLLLLDSTKEFLPSNEDCLSALHGNDEVQL
jgi:hypothetical protein